MRAPTDGYVTQVRLRPGMSVVASPQFIAAMTFVHAEDQELFAAFPQNGLQNIKAGYDAEIKFDAIPGRAFKGQVKQVQFTIAQGHLTPDPGGRLISFDTAAQLHQQGRAPIKIELLDDLSGYQLPPGAKAEVAVYSEHWHMFAIIRQILFRVRSWEKYIFIGD